MIHIKLCICKSITYVYTCILSQESTLRTQDADRTLTTNVGISIPWKTRDTKLFYIQIFVHSNLKVILLSSTESYIYIGFKNYTQNKYSQL